MVEILTINEFYIQITILTLLDIFKIRLLDCLSYYVMSHIPNISFYTFVCCNLLSKSIHFEIYENFMYN